MNSWEDLSKFLRKLTAVERSVIPVESYTTERQAEFLLASAVDAEDLVKAKEDVRAMGLNQMIF